MSACTRAGAVAQELHGIDGFDHRLGHRVNTIAGSIRVTFMMAAMADTTHISTVSTQQHRRHQRRDHDGQRRVGGRHDDDPADAGGDAEADHAR